MSSREEELRAREKALEAREQEIEKREEALRNKPFSRSVQQKKEEWYSRLHVTTRQMDVIIGITVALLAIVIVLIVLEAAGIFKLNF